MKFTTATIILALTSIAAANSAPPGFCDTGCLGKRAVSLTSKPREWINAMKGRSPASPGDASEVEIEQAAEEQD
jgi:hypothetical protein